MKKKILSMILAIAMVISMFAGLATTASAAGFAKATSIAVGDQVVLVCEGKLMEMTSISTTKTKYGIGTAYSGAPAGTMVFDVVNGASEGTVAFKNGDNYLCWTSGNSLDVSATLDANASWTVTIYENGNATIINAANSVREIAWNNGSPRFAAYDNTATSFSNYYSVQLYKYSDAACTHANATSSVTTEPTCRTPGEKTFTCPDCKETWTETIPATGHFWGEPVQTTAPTCTKDGVNTYTCSVCSGTKTEVIAATGHTYVGGTCSVCGAAEPAPSYYEPLTAAPAAWDGTYLIAHPVDGAVWIFNGTDAVNDYVSATPAEGGKILYADGMAVVTITTVEGGYTLQIGDKYMYSSGSSNGLTLGTTANANALEFTADGVVITYGSTTFRFNATSGQDRFRYYKTTTTGTSYTYPTLYKLVEETGEVPVEPVECPHAAVTEVPETPATCTTAGNSAYWSCIDCSKYFSDAACTTETTLEAVTIPATGHTPGAYTYNEDSTHTYTCSVCNDVVTESCSASVVEEVPATCIAYSQTEYECTVCGGTWSVTGTEYGAHTWADNACSVCKLCRHCRPSCGHHILFR